MESEDQLPELSTSVSRYLTSCHVPFRWLRHTRAALTVAEAAEQRGVTAETMIKALLLREKAAGGRFAMACIAGSRRLDLNAVRQHLGPNWKRLTFASEEEIVAVTSFSKGAMAPVPLPSALPLIFDEDIRLLPRVNISSGNPLAGIELASSELIKLCHPMFGQIHHE